MARSLQHIEQEIATLKLTIQSNEKEIQVVNAAISDAEQHVLAEDRVSFWEPKLLSLRQDKAFLLKKEERLEEEALVLEKSRLASLDIEAHSNEFGFYDMEGDDDNERRGRNTTWAGDHIALLAEKRQGVNGKASGVDDVKKVESSPSIMTKVEDGDIVNHDPNASLQGQHRRPHMGNLKCKPLEREDSFNVFGIGIEEDDVDASVKNSTLRLPNKVTRDVSERSVASESSDDQGDKQFSVGKFLNEFFVASESLVLAQGNDGSSRNNSTDKLAGEVPSSIVQQAKQWKEGVGLQPAVSTHDFSVFGAEMYNDGDDDEQ